MRRQSGITQTIERRLAKTKKMEDYKTRPIVCTGCEEMQKKRLYENENHSRDSRPAKDFFTSKKNGNIKRGCVANNE
jgi:hypothetical protein